MSQSSTTNPLAPPRLELFQTTLDNGLRIAIQQDPTTVLAAVNLWYGVGSRDEADDRTGFAHLFEHMMFQGSANVASGEHFAFLEKVGANLNATTSLDRTNYFEAVPVEHLDLALWLEADRMGSLSVTQENLDNQIEVVKEEKRQRYDNQPAGTMFLDILDTVFPEGHPYHHPPIGSMEHLDAADLDYVQTFHARYYGPNAAVMTIISPLDPQAVLERVKHFFDGIPAIPTPPATPSTSVDKIALDRAIRKTIPDRVLTPVMATAWRIPPYGTAENAAVQMALAVMGRGRGSRLARALTRDEQLVTPTSSYCSSMGWDGGVSLAISQLQCRDGVDPETVTDALTREFARLASEAPTEDEMVRARAMIASGWLRTLADVASRADEISRVNHKLGDATLINAELDHVFSVTAADVQRVAAEYLTMETSAVLAYVPTDSDEEAAA